MASALAHMRTCVYFPSVPAPLVSSQVSYSIYKVRSEHSLSCSAVTGKER